ncbi:MAG: TonB-dependent receptor [Gemmatimonas sp.]
MRISFGAALCAGGRLVARHRVPTGAIIQTSRTHRKKRFICAAIASALAVAALSSTPSHAQKQTARDSAAADSAQKLRGITVTATRNAASILTAPLAVTKISNSELQTYNGFGLDEALSRVPGVIARSRFGTSDVQLMIRGFGARGAGDRSNSGTTRGVRVLIDGFPETEPDGRTPLDQVDLSMAEAIEVVRSNASSAWGNASGGIVNILTAPTGALGPVLEFQPIVGAFGLQRFVANASMPLNGGSAWINFSNTNFDGWRVHSSAKRALVNAGVVGTIGHATRVGMYFTGTNNLIHVPGPLTQTQVDADPRQANATYLTRDERRYNRAGRLGVTAEHQIDPTTSISTMVFVNPKYLQRSERNTYRDFTRYHFGGNLMARKEINTANVRSKLMAGVDEAYQDGAILFYNLSATQGRGTTLSDNKGEGAQNFGIFAQDELTIRNRLTLLLGARYDRLSYNYHSYVAAPPVRADSKDFSRVSPKLGASFLLDASHSVYANIGGGIEIPAANETDPTPGSPPALLNPLLDPILSTSYEVGFKGAPSLTGGGQVSLNYDVALYNVEIKNEVVPYNGGRYYLTAAKARRQGAEIGFGATTVVGVFANAAITLSKNHYLNYVVDSAVIFPTDPTKVGKRADYSNHEVVGVPGAVANVEVGTSIPGFRALRVKGGVEHSGEYFADDANAVRVPAYTLLNLTAELRNPIVSANGWGVRGFVSVRNLTDRKFIGASFLNPDLVGTERAAFEPGMPRSVTLSLSVGRLR